MPVINSQIAETVDITTNGQHNVSQYTTANVAVDPSIESLSISATTSEQTITAPTGTDGYSPITVAPVTAAIDANITAGNIKKDVTILGVIGSYEGSGGDIFNLTRDKLGFIWIRPYEDYGRPLAMDWENDVVYQAEYDEWGTTTVTHLEVGTDRFEEDNDFSYAAFVGMVENLTIQPDDDSYYTMLVAPNINLYDSNGDIVRVIAAEQLDVLYDENGSDIGFYVFGTGETITVYTRDEDPETGEYVYDYNNPVSIPLKFIVESEWYGPEDVPVPTRYILLLPAENAGGE